MISTTATTSDLFCRSAEAGGEARFATRLIGLLDESSRTLPPGVEARLQFAREQAVAKSAARFATVRHSVPLGNVMAWIGWAGWLPRAGALLPMVALVVGLISIQQRHREDQVNVAVEIDSALLIDDAPLLAYRDAGFVEFLKSATN